MIPAKFQVRTPVTLTEAIAILSGDAGAAVIAGGQSLIPAMTLGRLAPTLLVDLRSIPDLRGLAAVAGVGLHIGAATTLDAVATAAQVRSGWAALAEAAESAGDPQVRNRGTVGGALADAHPAGDMIAAAIALGATVQVTGPSGARAIPAGQLVTGPYQTALQRGEIVTALDIPAAATSSGSAWVKQRHPGSGYALCAVAATVTVGADGAIDGASIAVTGAAGHPVGLPSVADALRGRPLGDVGAIAADAVAGAGLVFRSDLAASADYRAHLAGVLVGRAVAIAGSRAAPT